MGVLFLVITNISPTRLWATFHP